MTANALMRDSRVPLYVQIRDRIVAEIESGGLKAGDRLPSEPELVSDLRVGRPTVRQAIALLRQQGWVVTQRGLGTFIAGQEPQVSLMDFDGLTRSLRARGIQVEDRLLGSEEASSAPLEVLEAGGTAWWTVSRLRRIDGDGTSEPLCIETDAFNLNACPDAEEIFMATRSAAATLEDGYGYGVASCRVATRALGASAEAADLLGLSIGDPVLAMERVNRGADGTDVHVVNYTLRTDRVPIVEGLVNPAMGT